MAYMRSDVTVCCDIEGCPEQLTVKDVGMSLSSLLCGLSSAGWCTNGGEHLCQDHRDFYEEEDE